MLFFLFAGCRATKHVPDGSFLLAKNKIKTSKKEIPKDELKGYIRQQPNRKLLGTRFYLGLYNLSKPEKEKGLSGWFKKIGEEPVIYDPFLKDKTTSQLSVFLNNKGYFDAQVSDSVVYKRRKAKVFYYIDYNKPHRISKLNYEIVDSTIAPIILEDTVNRNFHVGDVFDVDVLQKERDRLERLLKKQGYYSFSKNYISYLADTTITQEQSVELTLKVSGFPMKVNNDSIQEVQHPTYRIQRVLIFPDFNQRDFINAELRPDFDTLSFNDYVYIFKDRERLYEEVISQSSFLEPGDAYSLDNVEKTRRMLNSLRLFRSINIQFVEAQSPDYTDSIPEGTLDCYIQLTPFLLQSYSVEVEGTNSSGNKLGFGGVFSYQHRSLFGGAEITDFRLSGSMESLNEQTISGENRTLELGANVGMRIPKFLLPIFRAEKFSKKYSPKTQINIGYSYQDRPDFTRTIATTTYGYEWEGTEYTRHFFDLLELNAVKLPHATEEFRAYIDTSFLRSSYENHLVSVTSYSYVFSNQDFRKRRNFSFFRLNTEVSGNLLSGVAELADINTVNGRYEVFGVPFSQYLKLDADLRYYQYLTEESNVAYRLFIGAGFPYGNSTALPFEKQYFSGGANSIRAWNVRDVGPGAYQGQSFTTIPNQTADIKMEANVEYRFDMFWVLEGALFLDAGNIWSMNPDGRDGGLFRKDEFFKEFAVGTGFGARFDFSYLIFRLDMGLKLRDPSLDPEHRWIPLERSFNSDDITFNIAIGYPF